MIQKFFQLKSFFFKHFYTPRWRSWNTKSAVWLAA